MLEPYRDRITWDAPIHSVADVEALPFPPRTLNSKPSRFGSLQGICDFYDHCAEHGIGLYGGGMFELGPGRGRSSTSPRSSTRMRRTTSRRRLQRLRATARPAGEPARIGSGTCGLPLGLKLRPAVHKLD